MPTITWQRNSALNGERVTWDAFIGGRRVAQIARNFRFTGDRPVPWWDVWANGNGGTHRKLAAAKAEVLFLMRDYREAP